MTNLAKSPTMLARTGESLFWLGRYLERAEQTARILDVHLHDLIGTTAMQRRRWSMEIQALAGQNPADIDFDELALGLSLSKSWPNSIHACIEKAWDNAKSARDTISLELWESINVTHSRLQRAYASDLGHSPHAFFAWVKDRGATCRGLQDTTMNRDQAWLFLNLGRTLELMDLTSRLLRVKLLDPDEEDWVVVLRCLGGHEAYIRSIRRPVEKGLAIEFLLTETIFPRSILHLAVQAQTSLGELGILIGESKRLQPMPASVARLIARLKYPIGDELSTEVLVRLSEVSVAQSDLWSHLNDTYFSPARDTTTNLPQRTEVWI